MNVVVFIPVGMILGSLLRVKGSWFFVLMIGCGISVAIELLQFFLRSQYKCRISSPFTPRNATSKLCFCVDVTIAERMTFHFYLEKTEEINEIITNA